jgi:hypothetical protein
MCEGGKVTWIDLEYNGKSAGKLCFSVMCEGGLGFGNMGTMGMGMGNVPTESMGMGGQSMPGTYSKTECMGSTGSPGTTCTTGPTGTTGTCPKKESM